MKFSEYQKESKKTCLREFSLEYLLIAIANETGELLGHYKKLARGDSGVEQEKTYHEMKLEAGDVLWYLARLAEKLGVSLDELAAMNIAKLKARHKK